MKMDCDIKTTFNHQNILVVGDFMLDRYIGGDVSRISPEAPIPVLKKSWVKEVLGGAGNVVSNIHSLGGKVKAATMLGDDDAAKKIMNLLKTIDCDVGHVAKDTARTTIVKTRVVARNQQVIRIDEESSNPPQNSFFEYLKKHFDEIINGITGVILSDYNKGILSKEVSEYIISECTKRIIPVFVDPKGADWTKYIGATVITPNIKELSDCVGAPIDNNEDDQIQKTGLNIVKKYAIKHLIVTRSEKGITLINDHVLSTFPVVKKEVIDVSGAGDTVISTIAMAYTSNYTLETCCTLANRAASIVVSKFGTSAVSIDELLLDLSNNESKIITINELKMISEQLHSERKKIVFTNGCFDLLHAGHVHSLKQAKSYGDYLIVGLNSDKSVKTLKGPSRPIIGEQERAFMLQSIQYVDYVVIFDTDTPEHLIQILKPDFLVKGEDYIEHTIAGQKYVESYGGKVMYLKMIPGLSTTAIITKILQR